MFAVSHPRVPSNGIYFGILLQCHFGDQKTNIWFKVFDHGCAILLGGNSSIFRDVFLIESEGRLLERPIYVDKNGVPEGGRVSRFRGDSRELLNGRWNEKWDNALRDRHS